MIYFLLVYFVHVDYIKKEDDFVLYFTEEAKDIFVSIYEHNKIPLSSFTKMANYNDVFHKRVVGLNEEVFDLYLNIANNKFYFLVGIVNRNIDNVLICQVFKTKTLADELENQNKYHLFRQIAIEYYLEKLKEEPFCFTINYQETDGVSELYRKTEFLILEQLFTKYRKRQLELDRINFKVRQNFKDIIDIFD